MDGPFFLFVVFTFLLVYVYLYDIFTNRKSNRNLHLHARKTGDRMEKG
jgi:hypothetical protein